MARILVMEDNPINLELMTYLLRAWGHETLTATDGASGIETATRERPDLIVCDIEMPGIDGYEVARRLKADAALAGVPLVAVTAFAMVGDREKALSAGFDAHVPKPIDPTRFVADLARFLPGAGAAPQPTAPGPAGQPRAVAPVDPALSAPAPGLAILVADDTATNLEFKTSLLEPAGYRVVTASSADEALDVLRGQRVDLVISDVVMGGGGGFELLAAVRGDPALRDLPFLFLTSTAREPAWCERAMAAGASGYVVRPVDPQRLLAEIRACLARR